MINITKKIIRVIFLSYFSKNKWNWIALAGSENLRKKPDSQFITSAVKHSFEHVSSVTIAWCWRGISKWEVTYFYRNSYFHTSGNVSRFFFAISFQIQKALQDFLLPFSYWIHSFCSITEALQSQASRYLPQDRTVLAFSPQREWLCKTGPCRNSQWKLPLPSMRTALCCRLDMLVANFEPVGKQWDL